MSVAGIRRLLERSGLEVVDLSTPGELDVDIVRNTAAENREIELPRFVQQLINNPEEAVSKKFQRFLKANKLSSHLRGIIRLQEKEEK